MAGDGHGQSRARRRLAGPAGTSMGARTSDGPGMMRVVRGHDRDAGSHRRCGQYRAELQRDPAGRHGAGRGGEL
jgi:hypothetical protein